MSTPQGHGGHGAASVVEVWAHNEEEELLRIRSLSLTLDYPIAVVAVSHDGPAVFPRTPDLEARYAAVRATVEGARRAQVALALADRRDGALARVWRFHVGDAGDHLADPRRVCCGVKAYCRTSVPIGMLVTWDGAEDVAYLIRHINGGLPQRRAEFLVEAGAWFQDLFDLRVLAEWTHLDGLPPPLAPDRSDGTLLRRFVALARSSGFWEVSRGYNAFLYGLGAADTPQLISLKVTCAQYKDILSRLKTPVQMHGKDYVKKH